MAKILCAGVLLMDFFPDRYGVSLDEAAYFIPMPGGAPANVAAAVSRLGGNSLFLGRVGDDAFGRQCVARIAASGVDVSHVQYDSERRTTANFHAKPDGRPTEYLFYRNPGADEALDYETLSPGLLDGCSVFHCDALALSAEPSQSTVVKLARDARKRGIAVSFDFNYRPPVWPSLETAVKAAEEMLPLCDILKVNDEEMALLRPGRDPVDGALDLVAFGLKLCVVTMGERGSVLVAKDAVFPIPAVAGEVVDTIGCGDSYLGALLLQLVESHWLAGDAAADKLRQAGLYAACAASITAAGKGALEPLPDRAAADRLLAAQT